MTIAGLDVGGSSIKRGIVDLPDRVLLADPAPLDSLGSTDLVLSQLSSAASDLLGQDVECTDLALAFPRPFDMAKGIPLLRGVDKFDAIYGIPLAPVLRSGVSRDLRISFCGDAVAAAVGEAVAGAGQSYRRVLMVTIGTGFGSALVVDGQPVDEYGGRVVEDIHHDRSGSRGPADEALSARGIAELLGVTMLEVAAAAEQPAYLETFEEFGQELGIFLAMQADHFQPDVVVVGGGVSGAFDLFGSQAAGLVDVPVVAAELGQRAPLLGAAMLHGQGSLL